MSIKVIDYQMAGEYMLVSRLDVADLCLQLDLGLEDATVGLMCKMSVCLDYIVRF